MEFRMVQVIIYYNNKVETTFFPNVTILSLNYCGFAKATKQFSNNERAFLISPKGKDKIKF